MRKRLCRLRGDNRGSGLVTVLVCMLLIVALGSTLLFTSYTAYKIKVTNRKSTVNFYNAETAMSLIRSGIQEVVTESIADAYSAVLIEYNSSLNTTDAFHTKFKEALCGWSHSVSYNKTNEIISGGVAVETTESKTETRKLFSTFDNVWSYDGIILASFIKDASPSASISVDKNGNVTITDSGNTINVSFTNSVSVANGKTITLGDIAVSYTSSEGYLTNVSSDIVITMPDFTYTISEYSLTGVPEFAMIARTALSQDSGGEAELELSGSAYAGEIDLSNSGNSLTVSGGTLISRGNVQVSGRKHAGSEARLVMESNASLWAGRISVGQDSSVKLFGDTYVADDLELAGNRASAVLSGRYYGFGYLEDDNIDTTDIAGTSSSIVINGTNTSLDLSSLNTLMLAGQSFISVDRTNGADVLMGQSISVKSDQLAYLVPASCLSVASNPYHFSGNTAPAVQVDLNTVLWGTGENSKSLGDYISDVKTVYSSGTHLAYYFMKFATKEDANNYFRDYFKYNSDAIEEYLHIYSSVLSSAKATQSSGLTYDLDPGSDSSSIDDDILSLFAGFTSGSINISAGRLKNMFENYIKTLTSSIPASSTTATDPYEYVINSTAVAELPQQESVFYDENGTAVALIVKNSGSAAYSVSSAVNRYPGVSLIIATGDVKVDYTGQYNATEFGFHGLIISGGTVTMNASLYADPNLVTDALASSTTDTADGTEQTLMHFMNVTSDVGGGENTEGATSTWDTDALVSYSNWKKY